MPETDFSRFRLGSSTLADLDALAASAGTRSQAWACYVEGCSHYVRYPDGRVEFRRDGRHGWVVRDAHPCEYAQLTDWRAVWSYPDGTVPTPAQDALDG